MSSIVKLVFAIATLSASAFAAATPFTGDGTFFQVGLGSCGSVNSNSDMIAAMNAPQYTSDICGQCAMVSANGQSVMVKIMDKCPECRFGSLDLSPAAFNSIGNPDAGRITISWVMVDCNSGAASTPAPPPADTSTQPSITSDNTNKGQTKALVASVPNSTASSSDSSPTSTNDNQSQQSNTPSKSDSSDKGSSRGGNGKCWRKNRPDKQNH